MASQREIQLERLAAARAVFESDRITTIDDYLIISVLVTLYSEPRPLDVEEIASQVRDVWITDRISSAAVENALRMAEDTDQVLRVRGGELDRYQLGDRGRRAVSDDRSYTNKLWSSFEEELFEHLSPRVHDPAILDPTLLQALCEELIDAFFTGSFIKAEYNFDADDAFPWHVEYDLQKLLDDLDGNELLDLTARSAFVAVARLLADPDSSLGKQILHLVFTFAIVRRLVTTDIPILSDLTGARLLIDTSVILQAFVDSDDEERRLLRCIDETVALGGKVVVPRQVVLEWERLWDRASQIYHNNQAKQGPERLHALLESEQALFQRFVREKTERPRLSWRVFEHNRMNFLSQLADEGARIDYAKDSHRSASVSELVDSLSKGQRDYYDSLIDLGRNRWGSLRDARTLETIGRLRRLAPADPPVAWMVAVDPLAEAAYRSVTEGDPYPCVTSVSGWREYLALVSGEIDLDGLPTFEARNERRRAAQTAAQVASTIGASELERVVELVESPLDTVALEDADQARNELAKGIQRFIAGTAEMREERRQVQVERSSSIDARQRDRRRDRWASQHQPASNPPSTEETTAPGSPTNWETRSAAAAVSLVAIGASVLSIIYFIPVSLGVLALGPVFDFFAIISVAYFGYIAAQCVLLGVIQAQANYLYSALRASKAWVGLIAGSALVGTLVQRI